MRLIDADALDRKVYNDIPISTFGSIKKMALIRQIIEDVPTIDAVPVVRCRECGAFRPLQDGGGLCWNTGFYVPEDGYCHDGERKGGDE